MNKLIRKAILYLSSFIILTACVGFTSCVPDSKERIINISKGWSGNSINTVVFRHNSLVSYKNYQYASFYDQFGNVILAKRKLGKSKWEIHKTKYSGNVKDAHNNIAIMIDGDGYLHMVWNEHNSPLHYCRSLYPEKLELTDELSMTGNKEQSITYPEFYKLVDGNLIFLYRDGESGSGNLVMNYYDTKDKKWINLHENLIDGEGKRNAYWQLAIDAIGTIHISWVWRETWDVETNHDICYAKSIDGGNSWQKSNGEKYKLPITLKTAEFIAHIPQGSELINQTSMCVDANGSPYISSYWRPKEEEIPQYYLIYYDGKNWLTKQISKRTTKFSLSGGGTKKIPISRPQVVINKNNVLYMIFRDIERENKVSLAACDNIENNNWHVRDLTTFSVGLWEPTYDTELWRTNEKLHLFIQNVGQGDSEKIDNISAQMVSILEIEPNN